MTRRQAWGKAYLRLMMDEIKPDGSELVVRGSHRRLADAIGFMEKGKLGEVPSFANDWARRLELSAVIPPQRVELRLSYSLRRETSSGTGLPKR